MNLEVIALGLPLSTRQRLELERKVASALTRFAARIARVVVRLSDQNGPRGGLDKRCRIEAVLSDGGHLFAEERDAKWPVAAARCAASIGRTVGRRVEQRREHGAMPV